MSQNMDPSQQPVQSGGVAATAAATLPESTVSMRGLQQQQQRPKLERGTMGRLSVQNINFDIPSNVGTKEHIVETHGHESWQHVVIQTIHSKPVEYTMAALLGLDILLLFTELLLLSYFPHCTLIIRDAISCCSSGISNSMNDTSLETISNDTAHSDDSNLRSMLLFRWLTETTTNSSEEDHSSHDSHHSEICSYPSVIDTTFDAGCDEHRYSGVHLTETILFALTIVILSLFFIELNLSMIALTPAIFFRQFFFALDYFIITVSLILEITFYTLSDTLYASLSGLLVIFRIWRFVRIGHGIVELTNEAVHHEYDKLYEYTNELRALLEAKNIPLPTNHPEMDAFFAPADASLPVLKHASHLNDGNDGEGPK